MAEPPVAANLRDIDQLRFDVALHSPRAAWLARELLGRWLEDHAVPPAAAADLLLVCAEVCTNAVRHRRGRDAQLRMLAWLEEGSVVLDFEDDDAGEPLLEDVPEAAEGDLRLAAALCDGLEIHVHDDRTAVRCTRALSPREA